MSILDRLSNIGTQLKQATFGSVEKSSLPYWGQKIIPSVYRNGDELFYAMTGNSSDRELWLGENCIDFHYAYFNCPPLSAIINRKAKAYVNGEPYVINTEGKAKDKESNSLIAQKIKNLMQQPNRLQSRDQFEAQNYIFTQLYGYCVVLAMKPVGFPFYEATELWNIPPHMISINEQQGLFYRNAGLGVESIRLTWGGASVDLPLDNVAIIKDIMPSFESVVIPDSRVRTLKMPINNIIGAYESRNMLINSRGALGMITNQTQDASSFINLKEGEKKELHQDFKKMYGLRRGQSEMIITSANLKWQPMVLPTKDLMLFEEIEDDGNRICDAYDFPPELFARMKGGTTFSNMATASRNLYQDAIMPECRNIYSQWNKIFEADKYKLEIGRDYRQLPALQAANKEEAEAKLRMVQALQIDFRNDVITKNEWRVATGRDPIEGGDVYYSQVKDTLGDAVNNDNTQVEDNINPRNQQDGNPANDGTPGQQA